MLQRGCTPLGISVSALGSHSMFTMPRLWECGQPKWEFRGPRPIKDHSVLYCDYISLMREKYTLMMQDNKTSKLKTLNAASILYVFKM